MRVVGVFRLTFAAVLCLLPAAARPGRAATDIADLVGRLDVAVYTDILDNMLETHAGDNRGFVIPDLVPTADHDLVRDRILAWFDGLGLEASLDPFSFSSYSGCNNVIGVLPGRITPDRVYIIGAHYDSVQNPGADDNASGVAGVMEAARVLAGQPLASTVMFVAWDAEEVGLKGSWHWVSTEDESVVDGVVNLDMIAYNHEGEDTATIYGSSSWRAKWIAAAATYAPDITIVEYTSEMNRSDNWYFEYYGRPSGGIIENDFNEFPNPYYHKLTDHVDMADYIDYEYAVKLLSSGVGLLLEEADMLLPGDADNDKTVGWADLAALRAHIGVASGADWTTCDFDADGRVNAEDYVLLKRNLGQSVAPAGGASVPEPTALLLLAAGAAVMTSPRRRHGRGF